MKLYVMPDYIPESEMKKIIETAEKQKESYQKWFNSLPEYRQRQIMFENMTDREFLEYITRQK